MSGLEFDAGRHRYVLDGERVPGVTMIIGKGLPKPGLPYWSARVVAQAAVDEVEGLAARVEREGGVPVVTDLRRRPWRARDKAAVRGTDVHALAEQVVHGREVEVPGRLASFVQAYVDLVDDLELEPVLTEARLANRASWYAGTCDLVATIGDDLWLLDLKTSKSVHGSFALQTAAYATAEFFVDTDGTEQPMPHIDRMGVIHITPDGARLHEFPSISDAWEAFVAVKAVADLIPTIDSWDMK